MLYTQTHTEIMGKYLKNTLLLDGHIPNAIGYSPLDLSTLSGKRTLVTEIACEQLTAGPEWPAPSAICNGMHSLRDS